MSTSPEQSSNSQTNTPIIMTRGVSNASIISIASIGSGGESPPSLNHTTLSNTLSPPQMSALSSSSTPNSPHLGVRPTSGNLVKGMKRKLLRKQHTPVLLNPQIPPPTVHEDPLDTGDNQAKRDLFMRMLKGWQIQPKKIRSFKRMKRRSDKLYHSDDGYTSDPGILREVRTFECPTLEDDDETDNDPDGTESRRRHAIKIQDLERKAEKIRRSLKEEDDTSIHDNDDEIDGVTDKSSQNRLTLRFSRSTVKSKSYSDHQRQKLEKIEAHIKELREGGTLDSRGARLRGRIEGGLKGMTFSGIKGRLTHAGIKFKRKRIHDSRTEEEVLDDEDDDDEIDQSTDDVIMETTEQDELISMLKLGLDDVRITSEECLEQNKKLKEELANHNVELAESLSIIMDKLQQERERGDRLEWQLNDITELYQREVGELRAQLTQIEHTTTNKCQDLEDIVEDFHLKYEQLDAHVHKIMDTNEPKVNHLVRKPMARVLSLVLILLAFIFKMVSILRQKPILFILLILLVIFFSSFYKSWIQRHGDVTNSTA